MKYRPDIDGLRAISVIAVIMFHSDIGLLSGGYVGVDVFFVISGYLITGLILKEIKSGNFSFIHFYQRRIARLLPALVITLLSVSIFGFLFYDNKAFDNLGKEIFFSAIGAANILFAQGANYFAQDEAVRPLIHLWSLGVEEQFYLIWPTILILLSLLNMRSALISMILLFIISFSMAVASVDGEPIKTYFYPQYRGFELVLGAFTALVMSSKHYDGIQFKKYLKEIITYVSFALVIAPMFLLDEKSTFPGVNTLYPCIGTALLIAFAHQTSISQLLSSAVLVFVGLISYPLYLYHQPIISYLHFFNLADNSVVVVFVATLISLPLSWLTYRFIEKPIRSLAHKKHKSPAIYVVPLTFSLALFAVSGLYVAKNNGIAERFQILNPFAYQVSTNSKTTFHTHYTRGINLSETTSEKSLFVGDSLLQQYVYPLSKALDLNREDIDTVTRGGCVLLKGVKFKDQFADISCNELREKLYRIDTHYKNVVISQSWDLYDKEILNVGTIDQNDRLAKWTPFIEKTIEHFNSIADNIILIGGHLKIEGTSALNPTIFLSAENYRNKLSNLRVSNTEDLLKSYSFFNGWKSDAFILHPVDIWSHQDREFTLHDNKWSFFSDSQHASSASTAYIEKRIKSILVTHRLNNISTSQ